MKYWLVFLALICAAEARAAYPERPITLIVTYSPSASSDLSARLHADRLKQHLGVPIIIENIDGALGERGSKRVAQAKPDGYTLGYLNDGQLISIPARYRVKGEPLPYHPSDFTPVAKVVDTTFVALARKGMPVETFADLVHLAQRGSHLINIGNGNPPGAIAAQVFQLYAAPVRGETVVRVSYRGEPAVMDDLLKGSINVMFSTLAIALPRIETKDVFPLGIVGPSRNPHLKEVPTLPEQGYDLYRHFKIWGSIVGPAGLPDEVVRRLSAAIEAVHTEEGLRHGLEKIGLVPSFERPELLKQRIAEQYETFTVFLRKTGITNYN